MPELPEVETIVRDIRPALIGRQLRQVSLSHNDVLRGVTRRRLLRDLTGASVREVFRRAKHAVFDLGDHRLVVQPGMTGSLVVSDRPLTGEETRYAVLRASLDDGRELVYRDVRRLGTLLPGRYEISVRVGSRILQITSGPREVEIPIDPGATVDLAETITVRPQAEE